MLEHLSEEEEFWPGAYETVGKEAVAACEEEILSGNLKKKGEDEEAFKMIVCSIWSAMGWKSKAALEYPTSPVPQLKPWGELGKLFQLFKGDLLVIFLNFLLQLTHYSPYTFVVNCKYF